MPNPKVRTLTIGGVTYDLQDNISGYITGITSSDVTTALGFTPYNATNPNGYTNNTGTITSVKTTAGAHTTINVSSGAANFNVPTKTSHLTNDSNYITTQYIENKTDYEIPVSRVGEIVVGETVIGTDSTNFPTSKAVVDYVDERVVQEMDAIDVGVISVNGKTGAVRLSASDVGALSSDIFIPYKTSQLTNDSGFITSYTDEKVKQEYLDSSNSAYHSVLLSYNTNDSDATSFVYKNSQLSYSTYSNTLKVGNIILNASSNDGAIYFGSLKLTGYSGTVKTITLPATTGTVALTSDIPTVPTNISSFTNDSGYLTASDIASVMTYKGTKANYAALPSTGNTTGDVWHLTDTGAEWAWDGSAWQELGTAIDLSGYVPIQSQGTSGSRSVRASITNENGKLTLAGWDLDDGGYLRPNYNGLLTIDSSGVSLGYYTTSNKTASSFPIVVHPSGVTITNVITPTSNTDAANKKYVDDSIGAISIPTKTSDLTNDSGFLTSFTETDPTVPSWAKASTKPSYTASEVGAMSTSHAANGITTAKINAWDAKSDFSGSYNDLTDKPTIPTVPTNISAFTNDSGYLTSYTETDPTVPSWAKASSKPSYGLTEISGTDDLRAIEALTGTSGLLKKTAANTWTLDTNTYLTSYTETDPTVPSWAKASTKPTYTAAEVGALPDSTVIPSKVSDLTNDSGFISSYTETDPVFSASAAAGITSTDISNWNAKVSDDKTWNSVTLNKSLMTTNQSIYVPYVTATTATEAKLVEIIEGTVTAHKIPKYDSNAYLYSTTPSANDNSTKVATTAYVDAAIPDTSGFVSKSGDTMSGRLTLAYSTSSNNGHSSGDLEFTGRDNTFTSFYVSGYNGSTSSYITKLKFQSGGTNSPNGAILDGIETPSDANSNYDKYAANKKYVDDSISAISIPTKTSDLTNDSNFTAKSTITATLTTTWSSKTQTVSVTGVTASNTVIITPAPASYNAYCEYGVYCSAQSSGTLTFTCDEVPTSSLTVNVLILN